eukprot:Gb_40486 [translate_table: standard]
MKWRISPKTQSMEAAQGQQNSDLAIAMALAKAMAPADDDDDDDFQCPNTTLSINQDLILKSYKMPTTKKQHNKPSSKPLKPLNTHERTRKKSKQNPRQGKENTNAAHPVQNTNATNPLHHATAISADRDESSPIEPSKQEKKINRVFLANNDFENLIRKEASKGMSIESRLLCRGKDHEVDHHPEVDEVLPLAEEPTESLRMEPETQLLRGGRGHQVDHNSGEDVLLRLAEEGSQCLSFDPGTQLNALMQLCCTGNQVSSHLDVNIEVPKVDGFCSEVEEDDIMSLMTQASSPSRISNNVDDKQNYLGQASSPCKTSNNNSDDKKYLAQSSNPCGIPNDDLGYQNCVDQGSSPCKHDGEREIHNTDNKNDQFLFDETEQLVHCPICGAEITHLNDEERETHTNDCLDKDEVETVISSLNKEEVETVISKSDTPKADALKTIVDVTPVIKWLETLSLSRYADIFIKEEIDWDTLQWLTEEDLSVMGITALGPRKKIVHALQDLRKGNTCLTGVNNNTVKAIANADDKSQLSESGNKLITEFFQGRSAVARRQISCHIETQQGEGRASMLSGQKRARKRSRPSAATLTGIPEWLCIPGTPFRVDAFRHLRGDCYHWFLTHFHTDHYQGLTRGFRYGKIYCSLITARLVNMRIGVSWDLLQVIPLNERINIEGVYVTFMDANHCPGSVIILFEPPNCKPVLHTGDFRFCQEMVTNPILESCNVHTLILDTTYCNPQYDFPKQETVIQFVLEAIQAEAFNPSTLFLIGTYTIGKERIFLEVARVLRKKVYVGAAKLRLLGCLGLPEEDMQWLTSNEQESHIHVVPLWTIASFKRMSFISKHYHGRYNSIVAFSPTGWTFGKGKKKTPGKRWQQGTIIRYEVPYSEHCSFVELKEFVKFVAPENIIPSVNNDSPQAADNMVALLLNEDT